MCRSLLAGRPGGQPEQEIRERQKCHETGRVIASMVELISEDFRAYTKIVLAPRQEYDVGNVKVITGCFAVVVVRSSQVQKRQEPQSGECPLLGVAEARLSLRPDR